MIVVAKDGDTRTSLLCRRYDDPSDLKERAMGRCVHSRTMRRMFNQRFRLSEYATAGTVVDYPTPGAPHNCLEFHHARITHADEYESGMVSAKLVTPAAWHIDSDGRGSRRLWISCWDMTFFPHCSESDWETMGLWVQSDELLCVSAAMTTSGTFTGSAVDRRGRVLRLP